MMQIMGRICNLGKESDAFDGHASVIHTGREFGIVHPKEPNFSKQLDRLMQSSGQTRILAQKLGFNTKVTPIKSLNELEVGKGMKEGEMIEIPGFYRTTEASDGVVVSLNGDTRLKIAVAIMNADCSVIEILAPNGEIAVMHGGFNNVDNPDGSSIVENAINYFRFQGFNSSQLVFRVGEAAHACCYGFKTENPEVHEKNLARAERLKKKYGFGVVKEIENEPRKGGVGFNVPLIATRQADKLGIRDFELENICTSCHGLLKEQMAIPDTFGTWYSNLRENPATEKANGYGSKSAVLVYSKI